MLALTASVPHALYFLASPGPPALTLLKIPPEYSNSHHCDTAVSHPGMRIPSHELFYANRHSVQDLVYSSAT
ncbi:uncharacterized protein BDW70DRAFT_143708 [Aspergillus foveolatus]|uniref:uncharacterized protein n=1 Tax=Aspergillus foveolatus TaxID=210207 RepID=UPI003CCCEFBA